MGGYWNEKVRPSMSAPLRLVGYSSSESSSVFSVEWGGVMMCLWVGVKSFIWLYKLLLNVQILREAVDVKGVLHLESCHQLSSKRVDLSSKLYLLIRTIFIDFKMCLFSFKLFIAAWAVSWKIQKACAACLLKSLFQLKLYYIAFIILSYYSTFNSLHSSNNNQII